MNEQEEIAGFEAWWIDNCTQLELINHARGKQIWLARAALDTPTPLDIESTHIEKAHREQEVLPMLSSLLTKI